VYVKRNVPEKEEFVQKVVEHLCVIEKEFSNVKLNASLGKIASNIVLGENKNVVSFVEFLQNMLKDVQHI